MAVLLAISSTPSLAEGERPWLVSLFSNVNRWDTSDVDNSGGQTLVYSQISYDSDAWGLALTGTYTDTRYSTTQATDSFEVKTFTDTAISSYYSMKSGRTSLRGGVDLSLPTGIHSFSSAQLTRVIADDISEDLMLVNNYGSGLNVSPHLAFTYDMSPVTLGLGAKYIFSGAYDPLTDVDNDSFDPGDQLLLLLSANVSIANNDFFMLFFSYATFGKDKLGSRDVFQNGDIFALEGKYLRQWSQVLRTTFGAVFTTQGKNESTGENNLLKSETGNSNANKIEVFADSAYDIRDRLTLTGVVGYKNVAGNGYSMGDDLYDAGRNVVYLEPGVIFFFDEDIYAMAKVRYSRVADKKDAFSAQDANYNVLNLDLGIVVNF